MPPEIHCATCDAVIAPGSQFCPGCGLPLTTTAAPAVYEEGPRFSAWKVLLLAGVLLFLAMEILK